MRSKFRQSIRSLTYAAGFGLISALSVHGQDKERVITWPPYAVGSIQRAGANTRLSAITDAVEIVSIEVAGHPIKVGQPFQADDDWLGGVTVRLKNISGLAITAAQMSFSLPETEAQDQGALKISLRYATGSSSKQPNEPRKLIGANEVFDLKLTDAEYQQERNRILQRGLSTGVLKLWISLTMVTFADGTHWSSACLKSSDPGNACPSATQ